MIVIWGTHAAHVPRGTVYDACAVCRCVQRFALVDHFEISHLYLVLQGRPRYCGSSRTCAHCRHVYPVNPAAYSGFLPDGIADEISVQEGVRQTNYALGQAFAGIAQAKQTSTTLTYRQDGEDMHLPLEHAVEQLEQMLFGGYYVHHLAAPLGQWTSLPSSEKRQLMQSIESTVIQAGGTWNPPQSDTLMAH